MHIANAALKEGTDQAKALSPAQKEFPELALKDQRALPSELYRDHFRFPNGTEATTDLNTASRALNWLSFLGGPLAITGPQGMGKSVLAWQILNEAENRGMVPIFVSAADIVTGQNLDKPNSGGRALPFSSPATLEAVLNKLAALRERGLEYGKSVVLAIDGIDPDNYLPNAIPGGTRLLKQIHAHGIKVILNIESERSIVRGGSLENYYQKLNPDNLSTPALVLRYDGSGAKTFTQQDLHFNKS